MPWKFSQNVLKNYKVTINTEKERKKPQNPNPTMSEAQQYTQESCENEKPESTPEDFMSYRETRCENDCVKKEQRTKKAKQTNKKPHISIVKESRFSPF